MSAEQLRTDLADALAGDGIKVYAFPPATVTPPAILLVPDDPYLEPLGMGTSRVEQRMLIRLRITIMVGWLDNPSALARLEREILRVHQELPKGFTLGPASRPQITQVGPSELLVSDIGVTAAATFVLDPFEDTFEETF